MTEAAGAGKVILLVEDEPLVRAVTADELRDNGFEVIEAADAQEALRLLRELDRVNVLLTDIRMPGELDGWDLAERVRERIPTVGVVYMSGYSVAPSRMVEGSRFLSKPYEPSVIASLVSSLAAGS